MTVGLARRRAKSANARPSAGRAFALLFADWRTTDARVPDGSPGPRGHATRSRRCQPASTALRHLAANPRPGSRQPASGPRRRAGCATATSPLEMAGTHAAFTRPPPSIQSARAAGETWALRFRLTARDMTRPSVPVQTLYGQSVGFPRANAMEATVSVTGFYSEAKMRTTVIVALAGSAAAFSPMMSMETGRRRIVQSGAAAVAAAPLLRSTPAAAKYDKVSCNAPSPLCLKRLCLCS